MPEPVSHDVADNTFTNPQLDSAITPPKERAKLRETMSSYFDELDAKSAAAPPEPPVTEEPHSEPVTEEPKTEPEPVEVPETPEAKEPPIAPKKEEPATEIPSDIDALEPHPNASPETKGQFKQLKEASKAAFKTAKTFRDKLAPLCRDLGVELGDKPEDVATALETLNTQIRSKMNGGIPPEVTAELEQLREATRVIGLHADEEFKAQYAKPIEKAYHAIIDKMATQFSASEEKVTEWANEMKRWEPNKLKDEWWTQQIQALDKASDITKAGFIRKVAELRELQERHDARALEIAGTQPNFEEYRKKQDERNFANYASEIRDETFKVLHGEKKDTLGKFLPEPVEGITDPEKLAAAKARNSKFEVMTRNFSNMIETWNSGPRKAARIALDHIEMLEKLPELQKTIEERDAQVKSLTEERDKLKTEITKKRKLADAPLKPESGTGVKGEPEKAKLPKGQKGGLEDAFKAWKTE